VKAEHIHLYLYLQIQIFKYQYGLCLICLIQKKKYYHIISIYLEMIVLAVVHFCLFLKQRYKIKYNFAFIYQTIQRRFYNISVSKKYINIWV